MNEDEKLLEEPAPELSFEEVVSLVQTLEERLSTLQSEVTGISFGKSKYQNGDVLVTKGKIAAGFADEIAVLSGDHALYRIWSGALDPEDANFRVDKDGNMESVGGTITGALFRTAATGERIEIDTTNTNQIRFYSDAVLYGQLEVDTVGGDGYINLLAQDEGAGLKIYTGIGASSFSSVELLANGGSFISEGNASNQYLSMVGAAAGYFQIHNGPSGEFIETDLLQVGDPGIPGALYIDVTGVVMQSL